MTSKKNVLYAQSGGVTAVINTTACGVIQAAREHTADIGTVYASANGILGVLHEELYDTSLESDADIAGLYHTPGGAFGSCRYKLKSPRENPQQYQRLFEIFKAYDIGYFFYNGGGDSQDTTYKIAEYSKQCGYRLCCIGLPKTVDNDLAHTDTCPGFGSVAKYIATSVREASLDVASMCRTSTKVFILEVMGRHAGWIAASAGLSLAANQQGPLIILFPEIPFNEATFLNRVDSVVKQFGYCTVVVSEGVKNSQGRFLSETNTVDAFGHAQLGGVAPNIAQLIKQKLNYKYHWAVADYLQRAARHLSAKTDVEQAYALGKAAISRAIDGQHNIMLTIERIADTPYQWQIGSAPLSEIANYEKKMPANYISDDGFGITTACYEYLLPLIAGEAYPPYRHGLPEYVTLTNQLVKKRIKEPFTT